MSTAMRIDLPNSRLLNAAALASLAFAAFLTVCLAFYLLARVGQNLVHVMQLVETAEAAGYPTHDFANVF